MVAVTVERAEAVHVELQRRLAHYPTHTELSDRLAAKADAHDMQVWYCSNRAWSGEAARQC